MVAVVTRWFGGTLLGAGGLVRAYGDAVRAGSRASRHAAARAAPRAPARLDHADAGRVESELRSRGIAVLDTRTAPGRRSASAYAPAERAAAPPARGRADRRRRGARAGGRALGRPAASVSRMFWMTAFLDLPRRLRPGVEFWRAVTGYALSPCAASTTSSRRSSRPTATPTSASSGSPTAEPGAFDLHVTVPVAATDEAVALGAHVGHPASHLRRPDVAGRVRGLLRSASRRAAAAPASGPAVIRRWSTRSASTSRRRRSTTECAFWRGAHRAGS